MMAYCLTYYYSLMDGIHCSDAKVHKSGVKACDWLIANAQRAFQMPIRFKNELKITKNKQVSIGFGFRGFIGRQMTSEEIEDYHENGDSTDGLLWNTQTRQLVSKERAKELEKAMKDEEVEA